MDINLEISKIKQLRKDINDVIQRVKTLNDCKEVQICITNLKRSIMWLGMDLKRIDSNNLSTNSEDHSTENNTTLVSDNLKL